MIAGKQSKHTRLLRIVDAWRAKFQPTGPFSMDPISQWALENELYPVPGFRDAAQIVEAWEKRLATAVEKS